MTTTTETNVQDLMEEWEVSENEVKQVAEHFELTVEDLCKAQDEDNLRLHCSYDDFFTWMHEDSDVSSLIELLKEGSNGINEEQIYTLSNEQVVFMYE